MLTSLTLLGPALSARAQVPTPTITIIPTLTILPTPSATPTLSATATATGTSVPTPTATLTILPTIPITLTPTPSPTVSITPTITPSATTTVTPSITPSATPTASPVASVVQAKPRRLKFRMELVFPPNGVQSNPLTVVISVSKKQPSPVQIQGLSISPPGEYTIQSNQCGTIAPGGTCQASIVFQPTGPRSRQSNLIITSNASNSPLVVPLFGHGKLGNIKIVPRSLGFGAVKVGQSSVQKPVTLSNKNPLPINLGAVVSSNPPNFKLQSNCGSTLSAGGQCTLQLQFTPQQNGPVGGTFFVNDNAAGNPQAIHVSGRGIGGPTPTATATATTSPSATPTITPGALPMRSLPVIR